MINLSSFVASSLYWALEAKVGYLYSGSQIIIGSVLSSVWVLSADLMSFLWSFPFQIHWKTWFLLEGDKQKQKWTTKKSHHFLYSGATYFKINVWPYKILDLTELLFLWRTDFLQIGAAQDQLFFYNLHHQAFFVLTGFLGPVSYWKIDTKHKWNAKLILE